MTRAQRRQTSRDQTDGERKALKALVEVGDIADRVQAVEQVELDVALLAERVGVDLGEPPPDPDLLGTAISHAVPRVELTAHLSPREIQALARALPESALRDDMLHYAAVKGTLLEDRATSAAKGLGLTDWETAQFVEMAKNPPPEDREPV